MQNRSCLTKRHVQKYTCSIEITFQVFQYLYTCYDLLFCIWIIHIFQLRCFERHKRAKTRFCWVMQNCYNNALTKLSSVLKITLKYRLWHNITCYDWCNLSSPPASSSFCNLRAEMAKMMCMKKKYGVCVWISWSVSRWDLCNWLPKVKPKWLLPQRCQSIRNYK